jgi:hypothetical protein
MRLVSLMLIASMVFPAAAAAAATDAGSSLDPGLPTGSARVRAALAQRQRQGSRPLKLRNYAHDVQPAGSDVKHPRFEARVDVWGQAARDPNEALATFLKNTDRAIYQGGQYAVTPYGSPSVDFVPLAKWVAKKLKNRTEENQEKTQEPQ